MTLSELQVRRCLQALFFLTLITGAGYGLLFVVKRVARPTLTISPREDQLVLRLTQQGYPLAYQKIHGGDHGAPIDQIDWQQVFLSFRASSSSVTP